MIVILGFCVSNYTALHQHEKNNTNAQKFKSRECSNKLSKNWNIQDKKYRDLKSFIANHIQPKSVLLIEFNSCHHECLPGYAKYFLDLGYHIDVLLPKGHEDCFDLLESKNKLDIYTFEDHREIYDNKLILQSLMDKYDNIFLNSIESYNSNKISNDLDLFNNPRTIGVAHNTKTAKSIKLRKLLNSKKVVTLGKFDIGTYINPHYFGEIENHVKNIKTTFIVVGNIQSFRKNHDSLIYAIKELKKRNLKFKVVVGGRYGKLEIPEEIKKYIDFKGQLSYKEMYKELKNSDYFLPLLDPRNNKHLKYKQSQVTGSAQLCYGFSKPTLIAEEFSEFYGFDSKNSIIYKNDLASAMEKAINCNNKNYQIMRTNLEYLSKNIFKESLNNLKTIVK